MMWPSPALYGHSKCDVSGVNDCNQMRWPQLDFTPDLTRHRFVCSAIFISTIKYTEQIPWCEPTGTQLHFKITHGINIHLQNPIKENVGENIASTFCIQEVLSRKLKSFICMECLK